MFHPERDEVGHYFRFQELKLGRRYRRGDTAASGPSGDVIAVDWEGVRPMQRNPRTTDHAPGSRIRVAQDEFNLAYCTVMQLLGQTFDGNPRVLGPAVGAMVGLKDRANALMCLPTEDGVAMAGPTFEYVAPADRLQSVSQIRSRMTPHATDEPHRASSQLELLFDLTFVVAVSRITAPLVDSIANGDGLRALTPFLQVFFLIWWAWMNFTWFASSYDTDDVVYRLLTLLQMAGVLVLAVGVPSALNNNDFLAHHARLLHHESRTRRALVESGDRGSGESRDCPALRRRDRERGSRLGAPSCPRRGRSAAAGLTAPDLRHPRGTRASVPLWLGRKGRTNWHPHHIAERYGLFAIILLGECILAAFSKVEVAIEGGGVSAALVTIAVAALVMIFALWWLYFLEPAGDGACPKPRSGGPLGLLRPIRRLRSARGSRCRS